MKKANDHAETLAHQRPKGRADLALRDGLIDIRAVRRHLREGWAADASRIAKWGDDAMAWPELANVGDAALAW